MKWSVRRKPIAGICHAPWLLTSTGCVRRRTLTSYHTIQYDVRYADGVDQEVGGGQKLGYQRPTIRYPAVNRAMLELFAEKKKGLEKGTRTAA